MKAYVFPGQGSQVKGMGKDLFDRYKELTLKADAILGYSIKDLCVNDPQNNLGQTQYTQPALYTVNYFSYLKEVEDTGKKPDFVAGHSLGEYAALAAAGVFDFETGLKLVSKRGELMSKATGGGMAAVIGLNEEDIARILKENNFGGIDIANFNSPGQIVISGKKDDIEKAQASFESAGAKMYVVLKVSGAFHSRYMEEARKEFSDFINSFTFNKPAIPVISNFTARPYTVKALKDNMTSQITGSVRWIESVRYLMGKGVKDFKEIGPGNVLTNMVGKITQQLSPLVVPDEPREDEVESAAEKKPVSSMWPDCKGITPENLGSADFKKDYNLKYAYMTGAMYKGVASKELVVAVGKAGMMGFLGTGGIPLSQVENDIKYIQAQLGLGQSYGMNLICDLNNPKKEEDTVDLYLKHGVRVIEAAAFMQMTPALVRYRLQGLEKGPDGQVNCRNKILGKVSRPEVAQGFMSPAPERVVNKLLGENKITSQQAELAKSVPMADDIIVEADSAGHTDMGVAYVLMPAMVILRNDMMKQYNYTRKIRIGAAGGIGTPEAAAAAYILGADFIVTGSINQCTVEAFTSDLVKDLLQVSNVQDTEYAPAGDMFEIGARVQVLKKGLFFPARANKLYELYKQYNSLDEIDPKTRQQIEEKYFHRTFADVWAETREYLARSNPKELEKAEKNPKTKMAHIFRWYFVHASRLARSGNPDQKVDYQVHCGPALGAFNQWVKGTSLEDWRNRHVDKIGLKLLEATAELLNRRFAEFTNQ